MKNPLVAIVMGSDSDLPVMQAAADQLTALQISSSLHILSAHRTPDRMAEFASTAQSKGYKVIIAGAGGAAHLPGMVAAHTILPVIGVPILSSNSLGGIDSLLSIVQMPNGVPVATVAINAAQNAGLLAAQMLALSDTALSDRLRHQKSELHAAVVKKDQAITRKVSSKTE